MRHHLRSGKMSDLKRVTYRDTDSFNIIKSLQRIHFAASVAVVGFSDEPMYVHLTTQQIMILCLREEEFVFFKGAPKMSDVCW